MRKPYLVITHVQTDTCWTTEVPGETGPKEPLLWWLWLGMKDGWKLRLRWPEKRV